MKKRILSGITPSSKKGLHLGNYFGAVKPHVGFQEKAECFYFIADYHALNTVYDPEQFTHNVYETYLDYMALGIDLDKTVFFIESSVKEIFELTEILSNVVTLAQMKRMHAYKDKLQDPNVEVDQINMGLFNYPILMAADILAFNADIIPVGEDQAQHVEIARDMAKSFNNRYGEIMKIPELFIKKGVERVVGTDGQRKMSKTLGNDLTIFASEDSIRSQIIGITTDPNRIQKDDPGDPSKNPIFSYMEIMDYDQTDLENLKARYKEGTIGDVEVKEIFLDFYLSYFKAFREKRAQLSQDRSQMLKTIRNQGEKATEVASDCLNKIRKAIGATLTL